MTREEILKMQAGRTMDALIEKTFNSIAKNPKDYLPRGLHYSTDIGAAWEVVKKVAGFENSNDFELRTTVRGWKCIFSDAHAEYSAGGETAPETICKSALLAKVAGVEV